MSDQNLDVQQLFGTVNTELSDVIKEVQQIQANLKLYQQAKESSNVNKLVEIKLETCRKSQLDGDTRYHLRNDVRNSFLH